MPPGTQHTFDYDLFHSLNGADLVAYMEPIVADPLARLDSVVLDRVSSELDEYDEYHLVYGLELAADHAPDVFAARGPRFLSHKSQAVRCAASRALSRLPNRLITKPIVDAARTALSSCPENERETWSRFLAGLDKRRHG